MIPRLKSASHLGGYRLRLEFWDGASGEIDLEDQLWGEVFRPLRDPEHFRRFAVHPQLYSLTWPNGANFSPEFLYRAIAA